MWKFPSLPEEVGQMEEEYPFMDIWNAGLPPEYNETASTLSISTTDDDMYYLGHMAEETLRVVGTKRPISPHVETNTSLFNKSRGGGYIPTERQHVFKILSLTGPACFPTLPPRLKKSGSEPALPTFLASENKGHDINKERSRKGSSGSSSCDLHGLLDVSWSGNSVPKDDGEEAETEEQETGSTVTFSCTSLDVLWFLEDTYCKQIPRPQDAQVTKSIKRSRGVKEIALQSSERAHDVMNFIESLQDRNTINENGRGVYCEETSSGPISPKDQPHGAHRVSANSRRSWKRVRRQISHQFYRFCCCLLTPKKRDTTSRSEQQSGSMVPKPQVCIRPGVVYQPQEEARPKLEEALSPKICC